MAWAKNVYIIFLKNGKHHFLEHLESKGFLLSSLFSQYLVLWGGTWSIQIVLKLRAVTPPQGFDLNHESLFFGPCCILNHYSKNMFVYVFLVEPRRNFGQGLFRPFFLVVGGTSAAVFDLWNFFGNPMVVGV